MTDETRQLEQLTAYLDGELSDTEREQVEAMIARDPSARRLLEELRRTARFVSDLPRAPAPPGLSAEITARLERAALLGESADARPVKFSVWARVFVAAAALAIIVTSGWLLLPDIPRRIASESPVALVTRAAPKSEAGPTERVDALDREGPSVQTFRQNIRGEESPESDTSGLRPAGPVAMGENAPRAGAADEAGSFDLRTTARTDSAHSGEMQLGAALESAEKSATVADGVAATRDSSAATPMALRQPPVTSRPAASQPTSQPAATQPATSQPAPAASQSTTRRPASTRPSDK